MICIPNVSTSEGGISFGLATIMAAQESNP